VHDFFEDDDILPAYSPPCGRGGFWIDGEMGERRGKTQDQGKAGWAGGVVLF
jgi:hypothetical protein